MEKKDTFLEGTFFLDINSPEIREFVERHSNGETPIEKAVSLFYAVRDLISYNPYLVSFNKNDFRASTTVRRKEGYCVQKAIVLAAAARAAGVPARVGFANVKNHMTTKKLRELMQSDIFVFHGYTELFLENRWVKATPAFNRSLCEKFNINPIDFNGRQDAIFHSFDRDGNIHMEYLHDYGAFNDFPFDMMFREYRKYYPHMFTEKQELKDFDGNFDKEE